MAPTDLVVSAAVGGPSLTGHVAAASEAGEGTRNTATNYGDDAFVPTTRASFVGFARGAGGEDETLVRRDRESFAVDETAGVLAVLTERGVALLDASEETMRKLFAEEEA